jgi:hypothetical protein
MNFRSTSNCDQPFEEKIARPVMMMNAFRTRTMIN